MARYKISKPKISNRAMATGVKRKVASAKPARGGKRKRK